MVGASFIGLEVAASLRQRGLEVDVLAPETVPLGRIMGPDLGRFIQRLHEARGVRFHLGRSAEAWDAARLSIPDGGVLEADCVILGVGVRPRLHLAEAAGLAVDRGVLVDRNMRTSAPGVFAAGDIARFPGPDGHPVRVEHWVAAERQGQAAALAMLGAPTGALGPPFFWSQHYDLAIRYVGYPADWDEARIDGSLEARDATVRYFRTGRLVAAASIGRDRENLAMAASLSGEDAA